jgi:O-antigen ligase
MSNSFGFLTFRSAVSRLPWKTFFFVLAVFILATPFDTTYSRINLLQEAQLFDKFEAAEQIEKGSLPRRVGLFSLGLFGLISLSRFKRNRFQINGFLGWLIIFFLLLAALSIIWGEDTLLTVRRVAILYLLVLGALAIAENHSIHAIVALTFFICFSTLLTSLLTELYFGDFQPFNETWRFGGLIHPVAQGQNCGLLIIAALAFHRSSRRRMPVYITMTAIALLFLALTKSRMPLACAVLGVGLYLRLTLPKPKNLLFAIFIGSVIVGCLMYFLLGDEIVLFGKKIVSMGRGEEAKSSMGTFTGRIPLWMECMRFVTERPLLGYGYDAFLTPRNLITISNKIGWVPSSPHSGYIATLLGLGFIGAGTLVLILMLSLKKSIALAKQTSDYAFFAAVLIWQCCMLFTESGLLTNPGFPTFLCMITFAKLVFFAERVKI